MSKKQFIRKSLLCFLLISILSTFSFAEEEIITLTEPEEEERISLEETISGESDEIENAWEIKISSFNSRLRFKDGYFYIYTRLGITNKLSLGWTVLERNEEIPVFDWHNFWRYKLKKYYLKIENSTQDNKIVIGNYALSYGQGLVFYTPLSELVRPIKIQPSGLTVEKGTNENTYLRGFAWEKKTKNWLTTIFYSSVYLDGEKNTDDSFDDDLNELRENYGSLETKTDLAENNNLKENLYGGRFAYQLDENTYLGITGYEAKYNPLVNPDKTDNGYKGLVSAESEKWGYIFRGEKNSVFGFDFSQKYKHWNFFGEYAYSNSNGSGSAVTVKGDAWLVGSILNFKKTYLFGSVYNYSPEYFNRHSKGEILFSDSVTQNQKGAVCGMKYKSKSQEFFLTYRLASIPKPLWSGYSTNHSPRYPADAWGIWFEYRQKLWKNLELYFRQWNDRRERYFYDSKTQTGTQVAQYRYRSRYQLTWQRKENLRFRMRYETKKERYPDLNQKDCGELYYFDVLSRIVPGFNLNARLILFDARDIYLSETEPYWNDVYLSQLLPKKKGERFYFLIEKKLTKNIAFWIKFEHILTESREQRIKFQFDFYH
ncbi:MAG TPA: hypothetical protein DHV62_08695 [Elusimicrobia bacterium]|nr:hypothetical protein [Elusimicrobiota bacterium]